MSARGGPMAKTAIISGRPARTRAAWCLWPEPPGPLRWTTFSVLCARMSVCAPMLSHVTTLRDPLAQVLGKKASDTYEKVFGLRTVGDLLRHYPRRYYTRGELTPLDSLSEGDHVTVLARVATSSVIGGPVPGLPRKAAPGRGPKQR